MTDRFVKKKSLNCPLIRIILRETEYPGNHAENSRAYKKASLQPGEKNQSLLPFEIKAWHLGSMYFLVVNINDENTSLKYSTDQGAEICGHSA